MYSVHSALIIPNEIFRPISRDSHRLQNDASNLELLNCETEEFLSSSTPGRAANVERRRRSKSRRHNVACVYCVYALVVFYATLLGAHGILRLVEGEWGGSVKSRQGGSLFSFISIKIQRSSDSSCNWPRSLYAGKLPRRGCIVSKV